MTVQSIVKTLNIPQLTNLLTVIKQNERVLSLITSTMTQLVCQLLGQHHGQERLGRIRPKTDDGVAMHRNVQQSNLNSHKIVV